MEVGKYSVPKEILALKPKGTMIKNIKGNFYVYENKAVKRANGTWGNKTGKYLGTITKEKGFIPQDNKLSEANNTIFEYGNYLLAYECTFSILENLLSVFNKDDAIEIYLIALIHFVEGYVPLSKLNDYFKQTYISYLLKDESLSFTKVSKLLTNIATKTDIPNKFISSFLYNSDEYVIDSHSLLSYSESNEMSEYGTKYSQEKLKQIDLLMIYDYKTSMPIYSKIFPGSIVDKTKFKDIFAEFSIENKLFIFDRGFYSVDNVSLIKRNNCHFITPLSENLLDYKKAIKDLKFDSTFLYKKGKKEAIIEVKKIEKTSKDIIYVFRDTEKNLKLSTSAYSDVVNTEKKYTLNDYNFDKPLFGTIVLETNLADKKPEEIYELYANRWNIETYFNYLKNDICYDKLNISSSNILCGLSFIMLIEGLIFGSFKNAIKGASSENIKNLLFDMKPLKLRVDTNKKRSYANNVTKKVKDTCDNIGIKILDNPTLHIPKN